MPRRQQLAPNERVGAGAIGVRDAGPEAAETGASAITAGATAPPEATDFVVTGAGSAVSPLSPGIGAASKEE